MNTPQKTFISFLALLILGWLPFLGCAELKKQWDQMTAFSQCQFRLVSVESTTVADIPLQGMTSLSDIDLMDLAKIRTVFTTGTLPLKLTLNLEVKNPNASTAAMNQFEWILYMDDNELTSGQLEKRVEIEPNGGIGTIPLEVAFDLRKTLSGKTLNSMLNLALNIAGEGDKPNRVSLRVKPSILVDGQELKYPGYIAVNHEFGKESN